MIRRSGIALALAGVLVVGASAATSAATSDEDRESTALLGVKLTLSQGIAAAEQRTGGKAFDAGVDVAGGKTHIVVETNGPKGVQTVTIDVPSGQVVSVQAGGQAD